MFFVFVTLSFCLLGGVWHNSTVVLIAFLSVFVVCPTVCFHCYWSCIKKLNTNRYIYPRIWRTNIVLLTVSLRFNDSSANGSLFGAILCTGPYRSQTESKCRLFGHRLVPSATGEHTRRGRSRAQYVRYREADVEGAKNWRLVHLQRSKGETRRAEPTIGLCFRAKAPKEANGEARRAEPMLWIL